MDAEKLASLFSLAAHIRVERLSSILLILNIYSSCGDTESVIP